MFNIPKQTIYAALAVLAFSVISPAMATTVTVQCADSRPFLSNTVICLTKGFFSFRSDGENVPYMVNVRAPRSHCSDVTYQILYPTRDSALGTSGRLRPGQAGLVEIGTGFVAGTHPLEIIAIGHRGGCNAGAIHSWAAEVDVVPVP